MNATVTIHEPGRIRAVDYRGGRDTNGRYPTTYWGLLRVHSQVGQAARYVQ